MTDRQTEPVISLEASNSAVEGDSINVSVIASVGTTSYLVIGVTVTEEVPGKIAGTLPTSVTLPAGATRTDLVLPTLTDGTSGTQAMVTVTLNDGSGYSVSSVTDKNTVNVTLSNARSIVTVAGPSDRDLTEGESITFTLTISSKLDNDTVIPVSYSDGTTSTFSGNRTIGSGDVLGDVLEPTVTIDRNSLSGSITIPTVQDAFDEDMGIVLVQFHRQQGSPYEFMQSVSNTSTTGNTLPEERNDVLQQFVVNDDDTPPVLSVEAEFDEIFEGFPAVFKFTSEGQSSADFPVNVMLTQTSSFLTERNTDVVTFKGRSNETTVNLMTDSGAFDNFEGSITLTIQNSSTKVGDNTPYYTVASEPVDANIAVIDVNDNDISVVEVSVVHNAINEGEVAQFTVTRSIGSGFALFVKVSVDQGDNDFIQGSPESTVVIPPNSSTMPYMVATIDDAKDENSGSVTVVLAEGMGYTLGNSYSNSVLVNDNDAPEISISMEELSVEEGNPARFTLTSVSMVDTSIRVRFSSIQNGDFVLWRMPSFVEIATGSDNAVIEIQTTDDNQREENGSISIMLQESVNGEYHLSGESGATRAAVTVTDNDGASGGSPPGVNYTIAGLALEMVLRESSGPAIPGQSSSPVTELPTISVESALPVIEEGSVAVFSVTMQETSKVTLIVEYLIEQEGEFVDRQSTGPVVLEAGRQSVDIEIQTIDDNQAEPDGTVTVVLSESTGYLVAEAPNNAATVKISDAADRKQRSDAIFHANSVVLPELAWTMGANSLDAVVARNVLGSETSIGLMGQSSLRDLLVAGGEAMNDEGLNWRSALLDSSFSIGLYPEGGSVESATVWGIGDTRNLHRSVYGTARSWKGEHSGGHFGFDTQLGKNGLIGMATSFTASSIDYAGNNEPALEIDMVSTGIQPYLGWKSTNGKTTLVVTVGHGPGTIQITETDYATEKATTTFNLVGVSASRHVSIWGNGIPSKQHGLNLSGKAWYVQQAVRANNSYVHALQVDAGQFRLTADAKNKWNTTSNSTLIPSATLGLVGNKLQSQSSIDVELGTGVEYNSPIGLELSGRGELLVSNIDRTKGRQIKGRLRYYQDKDGSGLGIEITPAWSDGVGPLQNPAQDQIPFSVPERREKSERVQLESEIGYGFAGVDERLRSTPFSGLDLNSDRGSKVRLGLRFETDRDFRLEILGSESLNSTENPVREVAMEGSYKW